MVAKFHEESPRAEGTRFCSHSPGHMADMPIYDNNLQKSSSPEPIDQSQ